MEVPHAGHCGVVNAAGKEFDTRVLGWFSSHDRDFRLVNGTGSKGLSSVAPQVVEQ
jgi:hypothetical protein